MAFFVITSDSDVLIDPADIVPMTAQHVAGCLCFFTSLAFSRSSRFSSSYTVAVLQILSSSELFVLEVS